MAKAETCHNCVFSRWDPGQWLASLSSGFPSRPTCANQPDAPGRWTECPLGRVCRNFRPRPPVPKGETVKTISVGDGLYAYVDAADFEWLNQWVWHLESGYAARSEKGRRILMHREIMKPPKGMVVDHKYRNRLDNTRESLRVCTPGENASNRGKKRGCSSRFLGVSYHKKDRKWHATLCWNGGTIFLGAFREEIDAARAYDHAAVEYFGAAAKLNFPEEWPPERIREVYAKGLPHRSSRAGRASRRQRRTKESKNHGQDARATKRQAKQKGRRSGKRASHGRKRTGDGKNHGREARATKRRKPVRKGRRKR